MTEATAPASLGGSGRTYNDGALPPYPMAKGGHRANFMLALQDVVALTQFAANMALSALNAPGTSATSVTANNLGTGLKNFVIQTGKAFVVGQPLILVDTANPTTKYMVGQIASHNNGTGALGVQVTAFAGAGAVNNWTIALGPLPREIGAMLLTAAGMQQWDGNALQNITSDQAKLIRSLYVLATGEMRQYDGAAVQALAAAGLKVTDLVYRAASGLKYWTGAAELSIGTEIQDFIASGTWTKPPNKSFHLVLVQGSAGGSMGGSKGGSTIAHGGASAAAGQFAWTIYADADLPSSVAATIGAAGTRGLGATAVDTTGGVGTNGGVTSFGTLLVVAGGLAATAYNAVAARTTFFSSFLAQSDNDGAPGAIGTSGSQAPGRSSINGAPSGGAGSATNAAGVFFAGTAGGKKLGTADGQGSPAGTSNATTPTAGTNGTADKAPGGGGAADTGSGAPGGDAYPNSGQSGGGGGGTRSGTKAGDAGLSSAGRVTVISF